MYNKSYANVKFFNTLADEATHQNNPEAHKAALSHPDLLDTLLSALGTELDARVRHRFVFALGSLIRSDRAALVLFYERKGLEVLEGLYNSKSTDADLEGKLLDLVRDALDKDMFPILSADSSKTDDKKNAFLTGTELVAKGYWAMESVSFWCSVALPGSDLVTFLELQFGTHCSSP